MPRNKWLTLLALPLTLAAAACDDDETGPDDEEFVATLNGQNERPAPVTTPANGRAEFVINEDGTLSYELTVGNIQNVVAAHIHGPADAETNAGVLVDLFGSATPLDVPSSQQISEGTITASTTINRITYDSLLVLIRNGNTYVNVHTNDGVAPTNTGPGDFPAGEIRGQINKSN